jgi:DNA-directed RNA polymerase subunit K/omega
MGRVKTVSVCALAELLGSIANTLVRRRHHHHHHHQVEAATWVEVGAILASMRTTARAMSQHTVLLATTQTVGQALQEVEAGAILASMRTTARAMSQRTVLLATTRTVGQALQEVEAEEAEAAALHTLTRPTTGALATQVTL